jgi:hypothetical protein
MISNKTKKPRLRKFKWHFTKLMKNRKMKQKMEVSGIINILNHFMVRLSFEGIEQMKNNP